MTESDPGAADRTSATRASVAVAVAVVAVIAALVVLATHESPPAAVSDNAFEMPTTTEPVEPESSAPPHIARWQIDAAEVYGRTFAAFTSPTESMQFDSGTLAVIDAGDVLVAAVGLPNPRTYLLDDAEVVGIDAADGAVRWSVSTDGGLDRCAEAPVRGEIVCLEPYSDDPALVAIDPRDGTTRRIPIPAGWSPYAISTDGTSFYVLEGNPEDGESVLHGGDVDSLVNAWSLPVPAFSPYEGLEGTLIHLDGGRGVVTLGGEATFFDPRTGTPIDGLELSSPSTVVDAVSGVEVWRLDEPSGVETTVGNTVFSLKESSVVASTADTGDEQWAWSVPTDAEGLPASGTIIPVGSAVYFVSSTFLVQLVAS